MSVDATSLLRYILIDTRLRKEPQPSLQDLKIFCKKELETIPNKKLVITNNSIKSDLKFLRKYFFAPVGYSFHTNRYFYKFKNYSLLKLPDNVMECLSNNLKLHLLLGNKFNIDNILQFDEENLITGWEFLPLIAKAIVDSKVIKFIYKSPKSKRSREYIVHPYFLKEAGNMWYLVGKMNKSSEVKIFALNSIINAPAITKTHFERIKNLDVNKQKFK